MYLFSGEMNPLSMSACPGLQCETGAASGLFDSQTQLVAHEIWPWFPYRILQTEYTVDQR
jgi:hypothetical protein